MWKPVWIAPHDIAAYFQLLEHNGKEVFVPKFTYIPDSWGRAVRASRKGSAARPHGTARKRPASPEKQCGHVKKPRMTKPTGARCIVGLRHELAAITQMVKCSKGYGINDDRLPRRKFFTAECHCAQRPIKNRTLKYWFGLTNDYEDFTTLVLIFHRRDGLIEEHSRDKRREPLTPFEQCLIAKSYGPVSPIGCMDCYPLNFGCAV